MPSPMRRLGIRLVPILVLLASFVGTSWVMARLRGPAVEAAPGAIPARVRPQTEPAYAREPEVSEAAIAREPRATLSQEALVRAAAEAAAAAEERARSELVQEAESADESLEVRLDLYLDALARALEASGNASLMAYRGVWTEHFLRLEAVQAELASLPAEQRASALDSVRRRMGFDEAQRARLAERDAQREESWQVGLSYMQERERLEASYAGEALEEELHALRVERFGPRAHTIALEEESGFYRFERPRVYGRN